MIQKAEGSLGKQQETQKAGRSCMQGFTVFGGKKITLLYGPDAKLGKKWQHLQGLSAINCHICDYNT